MRGSLGEKHDSAAALWVPETHRNLCIVTIIIVIIIIIIIMIYFHQLTIVWLLNSIQTDRLVKRVTCLPL